MSSGPGPADRIGLKHGAGGRAMRTLIEEVFLPLGGPVDGVDPERIGQKFGHLA